MFLIHSSLLLSYFNFVCIYCSTTTNFRYHYKWQSLCVYNNYYHHLYFLLKVFLFFYDINLPTPISLLICKRWVKRPGSEKNINTSRMVRIFDYFKTIFFYWIEFTSGKTSKAYDLLGGHIVCLGGYCNRFSVFLQINVVKR